ncbi:hypothetical protein IEQ34_001200 [Dendrobium chrysotoxum]|uniref:Uncharacterized protein n=1 Tax=Dendrobium chrysotoxum TaxID=161865 RepID=A0AAV7HMM8_DENCH|nr:hypothetical protein IEQ34_001200 [Dendrobium chrysotoxum]
MISIMPFQRKPTKVFVDDLRLWLIVEASLALINFFVNLKLSGDFFDILLDPRHVFFKHSNDLDYSRIFCHHFYYVFNCFMKLIKWSPMLISMRNPQSCKSGSCSLIEDLTFFSPRILHELGSLFSHPLQTDNATSHGTRPLCLAMRKMNVLFFIPISKRTILSYQRILFFNPLMTPPIST